MKSMLIKTSIPTPAIPEVMTVPELAEYLRVHPITIYRLLHAGRLPGFRVGSEWRFNRATIEKWQQGAEHGIKKRRRG
jgi:excisionase family DNA binding protein